MANPEDYKSKKDKIESFEFPVLFYHLTIKDPPYFKVLENRILNFTVFESFADLNSDYDNLFAIKSFTRMIDSHGNLYSTSNINTNEFNLEDLEKIGHKTIEEIIELIDPFLKRIEYKEKEIVIRNETIADIFIKLFELQERT